MAPPADQEQQGKDNNKTSEGGKEGKAGKKDAAPAPEPKKPVLALDLLHENLQLLEASVANKDVAGVKRVLRKNTVVRKQIALDDFRCVLDLWLPGSVRLHAELDAAQQHDASSDAGTGAMEVEGGAAAGAAAAKALEAGKALEVAREARRKELGKLERRAHSGPEVEAYLGLFVANALLARKLVAAAASAVAALIVQVQGAEARPTLDVLLARAYYVKAVCAERGGRLGELRGELLAAHRTACLRMSEFLQATLVNLLLRSFCEANLVEQAAKFASRASFPESVSNNQQVRYLFYMGRIHALQLDYSLAVAKLTQAQRKAPQNTALGFRVAVHKLTAIVQLLMGDVPERQQFSSPALAGPLKPYFELCKAVRNGSLVEYDHVCKHHANIFARDHLATLVVRLRNSVIRTGLRRINASYSRISFQDVAQRLALDSPESAELACAKAIRDGVIEATINHEAGHLLSSEVLDIYSTIEPQQAFHKRIQFCLAMHNDAVKAMRYPPDAHKVKHDVGEDGDEDKKTDEELAEELEDELEDE
jgi:26S proteasome regulatory subunit N3